MPLRSSSRSAFPTGTRVRVLYEDGKYYGGTVIEHPEAAEPEGAREVAIGMVCVEYDADSDEDTEWSVVEPEDVTVEKKRKRRQVANVNFIDDDSCNEQADYNDFDDKDDIDVSLSVDRAIRNVYSDVGSFADLDRIDAAVQDCVRVVRTSCKSPKRWDCLVHTDTTSSRVARIDQVCAMCKSTKATTWLFKTPSGHFRLGVDCASKVSAAACMLQWRREIFEYDTAEEAVEHFNRAQLAVYSCQ